MRKPPRIAAQSPPRARRSTTRHQKLYGSQKWRRASEAFRARPENVLCRPCRTRGKIVVSAAVDHIVPHRGDLELFWDERNWQGICASCHSAKSRADEVEARTGRRPQLRGCDQRGFPLDPAHPFNQDRSP